MQTTTDIDADEIETKLVNGTLSWVFPDGSVHPVIRGGATDDEDDLDDDDGDGDDDQDGDDDGDDGDDSDGDGDDADGDEDDDVEQLVGHIVSRVREELEDMGLVTQSELDRRINGVVRKVTKRSNSSSRSRRRDDDDGDRDERDEFSERAARIAGNEMIRDGLGRMTETERDVARSMLQAEIARQRRSGEDDEDVVGEAAGAAVVQRLKKLRRDSKRSTGRTERQRGGGASRQRSRTRSSSARSTSKQMAEGARRAAERFGAGADDDKE